MASKKINSWASLAELNGVNYFVFRKRYDAEFKKRMNKLERKSYRKNKAIRNKRTHDYYAKQRQMVLELIELKKKMNEQSQIDKNDNS